MTPLIAGIIFGALVFVTAIAWVTRLLPTVQAQSVLRRAHPAALVFVTARVDLPEDLPGYHPVLVDERGVGFWSNGTRPVELALLPWSRIAGAERTTKVEGLEMIEGAHDVETPAMQLRLTGGEIVALVAVHGFALGPFESGATRIDELVAGIEARRPRG